MLLYLGLKKRIIMYILKHISSEEKLFVHKNKLNKNIHSHIYRHTGTHALQKYIGLKKNNYVINPSLQ